MKIILASLEVGIIKILLLISKLVNPFLPDRVAGDPINPMGIGTIPAGMG
jgi:hypothetical protein